MFASFLQLIALLSPAAAKVYTGFNYGAFWSDQSNAKRYADFHHGFELAKNLTDTPVPFDSARLYTCITAGTENDPTEAFQAAIDTGTNLLLGMWVSPVVTGQANDMYVENELAALGKGFDQHGQQLAALVIGLSVGSEDVYRFNNGQPGLDSDHLTRTLSSVREKIAASRFAKYMEGKPIGHTDTAPYSVIPGNDFSGMNAYPFWEGVPIENAKTSFMSVLKDTERRAGKAPVWITELGWPIDGAQVREAVASADNYQQYWSEVGCRVFGKYNTFWFELLQDSPPDQPDWGLLDTTSHQPRIKHLSCDDKANLTVPTSHQLLEISKVSPVKPESTTFTTVYVPPSDPAPIMTLLSTVLETSTKR
ncbi:hypothetical protein OPT61_g3487 [Boeremia exigua]|uniref:Uncharacterized protein n=1 Tax=Boeremia exigua TaxID=749465 RepID=A0ACC2IHT2_9PLEO|nr:hypothetical protein OPT61_g3487 [Boeremia exigua]